MSITAAQATLEAEEQRRCMTHHSWFHHEGWLMAGSLAPPGIHVGVHSGPAVGMVQPLAKLAEGKRDGFDHLPLVFPGQVTFIQLSVPCHLPQVISQRFDAGELRHIDEGIMRQECGVVGPASYDRNDIHHLHGVVQFFCQVILA